MSYVVKSIPDLVQYFIFVHVSVNRVSFRLICQSHTLKCHEVADVQAHAYIHTQRFLEQTYAHIDENAPSTEMQMRVCVLKNTSNNDRNS